HLAVVIFGDVKLDSTGLHFMNPEYELMSEDLESLRTARIVPFYEKTGVVTPNMQRRIVRQALEQLPAAVPDLLPPDVLTRLGLVPRRVAIEEAHFPPNEARLDERIRASAAKILPFRLTPGQKQALKEIVEDMLRPQPMHRLLQGDVGAGKTIVALLAAIVAMENGLQVAFMAPTEILAAQHFGNIARLLSQSRFRVDILTGSTPGLKKHTLHAHIERGTTNLIVGTHALVQESIAFHKLGLVVIDEQHRFGVAQRAALRAK